MDERLKLIKPAEAYAGQIREYREEFLQAGDSMDGTGSLIRLTDPLDWLKEMVDLEREETCLPNLVPCTQYICIREADDRLVGMIQIRHRLNEYLANYGGHIGYSVRPSERRKGYASWMLAAVLPLCVEHGLNRVLITCKETNEGSRRTILKNGGVYERTTLEPSDQVRLQHYWISVEDK